MASFDCYLAQVGAVDLQEPPTTFAERSLNAIFSEASSAEVQIRFDDSWWSSPFMANENLIDAYDLHESLGSVTQNPIEAERVNVIAVLFSPRYKWRDSVFGVMFDRGRPTQDDPNDVAKFIDVPREGCAVFVEAIRLARAENFEDELAYTVVHELGHVFNLQHEHSPTFMSENLNLRNREPASIRFSDAHQELLRSCETDNRVHPGGSVFAGEHNGSAHRDSSNGAQLSVSLSSTRIHAHDPLELDIFLSGSQKGLLDRFDPGYSEFDVWIRGPDQTARTLHSAEHFCSYPSPLNTVGSFSRDIYLDFNALGRADLKDGDYEIWATYKDDSAGVFLVSNIVVLSVIDTEPRHQLLRSSWFKSLCKFKRPVSEKLANSLREEVPWSDNGVAEIVEYTLLRSSNNPTDIKEVARRLSQSHSLGGHRRRRCEQLLEYELGR